MEVVVQATAAKPERDVMRREWEMGRVGTAVGGSG